MIPIKVPGKGPPPLPVIEAAPVGPQNFCFKACIYGGSNTGKSTLIASYIRYIWKTFKRKTRVLVADSGGTIAYDPLVKAGVVDLFLFQEFYESSISAEALIRAVTKGVWFKRSNGKIEVVNEPVPAEVGGFVFEGLDSACNFIGNEMIEKGLKIGQDTVGQYDIEDYLTGETVKGGKMAPAHYGVIQDNVLRSYIPNIWSLPFQDFIIVTTHDSTGKDEDANAQGKAYGPALIGSAGTKKAPQQMVVLLHTDVVAMKQTTGEMASQYRIYYDQHQDPNNPLKLGAIYSANARLDLHAYTKLKKKFPQQYLVSDPTSPYGSLTEFINAWKQYLQESMDDLS